MKYVIRKYTTRSFKEWNVESASLEEAQSEALRISKYRCIPRKPGLNLSNSLFLLEIGENDQLIHRYEYSNNNPTNVHKWVLR